jgi:hypothetical protein
LASAFASAGDGAAVLAQRRRGGLLDLDRVLGVGRVDQRVLDGPDGLLAIRHRAGAPLALLVARAVAARRAQGRHLGREPWSACSARRGLLVHERPARAHPAASSGGTSGVRPRASRSVAVEPRVARAALAYTTLVRLHRRGRAASTVAAPSSSPSTRWHAPRRGRRPPARLRSRGPGARWPDRHRLGAALGHHLVP